MNWPTSLSLMCKTCNSQQAINETINDIIWYLQYIKYRQRTNHLGHTRKTIGSLIKDSFKMEWPCTVY